LRRIVPDCRFGALVWIDPIGRSGALRLGARLGPVGIAPGRVDLTALGVIQPTKIERLTDAVRDLDIFAGGIRNAGSNLDLARFAIDGDPEIGWMPDPEAKPESWFIEVDLGRAVSAHSVTLVFAAEAPPSCSSTC